VKRIELIKADNTGDNIVSDSNIFVGKTGG
jgi:hypothetical protein